MKYTTEINISESIKTFQKMESRIQKENEKKETFKLQKKLGKDHLKKLNPHSAKTFRRRKPPQIKSF